MENSGDEARASTVSGGRPALAPPLLLAEPTPSAAKGPVVPARQRVLDAIAWFGSLGIDAPEREVVALIAGASARSSGFANNLGALRTAGLVDYPEGGLVMLTEAGRAAAVTPSAVLTHDAIAAAVRDRLVPAQWRLLDLLIRSYPHERARDALAAAADVSAASSGFANNLGRLRSLGLVTCPAGGFVRAADLLFPGSRS